MLTLAELQNLLVLTRKAQISGDDAATVAALQKTLIDLITALQEAGRSSEGCPP